MKVILVTLFITCVLNQVSTKQGVQISRGKSGVIKFQHPSEKKLKVPAHPQVKKEDECGTTAFKCYKEVLEYADKNASTCNWKIMNSFRQLPSECANFDLVTGTFPDSFADIMHYYDMCDLFKKFWSCVSPACANDLQVQTAVTESKQHCLNMSKWISEAHCDQDCNRHDWYNYLYTNKYSTSYCPIKGDREMAVDLIKLQWLLYLTYIRYGAGVVHESKADTNPLLAEIYARWQCKQLQHTACGVQRKRYYCTIDHYTWFDILTNGYGRQELKCAKYTGPFMKQCYENVHNYCSYNNQTGNMTLSHDVADIDSVYNYEKVQQETGNWTQIFVQSEIISGLSACDERNLMFKQMSCYGKYFAGFNLNFISQKGYLSEYMHKHLPAFDTCWNKFADKCPEQMQHFTSMKKFLVSQHEFLAQVKVDKDYCPIHSVFITGGKEGYDIGYSPEYLLAQVIGVYLETAKVLISPEHKQYAEIIISALENFKRHLLDYNNTIHLKSLKQPLTIIWAVCSNDTLTKYENYIDSTFQFYDQAFPILGQSLDHLVDVLKKK